MSDPGNAAIRCLAVRQPWAWALVSGFKDVENRTWSTDYRGPIAILASASKSEVNWFSRAHDLPALGSPYGAIVGVVDVLDVLPLAAELEKNLWAVGPQCWRLANARIFDEPIPCKGKLNLFTLDEATATRVRGAIKSARPGENTADAQRWVTAMTDRGSPAERYGALVDAYLSLADGESILRLASEELSLGPSAMALVHRAQGKFALTRFDEALADTAEAIAMDETCAPAHFIRSLAHRALADVSAERAAELDPRFASGASESGEDE